MQRPWQPTPFNRALFEGDLTIGDPVVESDWPLNPNKAGKAFLDMIKDEWNSTQVLSNKIPNTIKLFKGLYSGKTYGLVHKCQPTKISKGRWSLKNTLVAGYDENDNIVWNSKIVAKTPSSDECQALQPYEFEDDSYLDSNIQLVACNSYSVNGGFTGNKAAIITDRTELYSSIRYLIQDEQRGSIYILKVAVKMLEAKSGQEYRIKVRHFIPSYDCTGH